MPEEIRGISKPEDIRDNPQAAARLLDVDVDASDEEVTDAFRDIVPLVHPDQGGTSQLFKAADEARELLEGFVPAGGTTRDSDTSSSSSGGGTTRDSTTSGASGSGSSADTGGFGGGQEVDEELIESIEEMLRSKMTEEQLKDKYFEDTTFRDVAKILASLVMSGNIDLGSLERMVNGDDRFSSSVGSATGGNFSRGGGGNFGGSSNFSSNPDDFMGYGSSKDDDEDDDDDGGPRNARGSDFGGM